LFVRSEQKRFAHVETFGESETADRFRKQRLTQRDAEAPFLEPHQPSDYPLGMTSRCRGQSIAGKNPAADK
jgi:hypothetical protein